MTKDTWLIISGAAGLVAGIMVLVPAYFAERPAAKADRIHVAPPPPQPQQPQQPQQQPQVRTIPMEKQEPRITYVVPVPAIVPVPALPPAGMPPPPPPAPPEVLDQHDTDVTSKKEATQEPPIEPARIGDICNRTGGKRVDFGKKWRCVYAHDHRLTRHHRKHNG